MWKNVIIVILLGLLIYSNSSSVQTPEQFSYPILCPNGTIVMSPNPCPIGTRCANGKVVYPPNRC